MKRLTAVLFVLCFALTLAVCDTPAQAADGKKLTFALLPKTLTNPYFVAMQKFAQESSDRYGITLECIAPPDETKIEEQIGMFETMLEKKVDAILIVPCGTTEIVSSIEAANKAGILVFCLDTNANGGDVTSFIGTDNFAGGKLAGEWVGKNIGSGKISIITGTPGNKTHEDRVNGFLEGIKGFAGLSVAGNVTPAYSDRAQGMSQAENLLTANPDIKVLYCTNDEMAMGAGEAVKARGLSDKITVIGFDGAPSSAQGIIDGIMHASVAQAPGRMAQLGIEAAYEFITNGKKPEAEVDTGCVMVTKDNAQEYLNWH